MRRNGMLAVSLAALLGACTTAVDRSPDIMDDQDQDPPSDEIDARVPVARPPDAAGGAAPADAAETGPVPSDAGQGALSDGFIPSPTDGAFAVEAGRDAGPASANSCAGGTYPVCIDFETGAVDSKWKVGADMTIEAGMAAHGKYALRLTNLVHRKRSMLSTTQLGTIKNVLWARFYMHMTPGAPAGHTPVFYADDDKGNQWELGVEYNSFMADFHGVGTAERPSYTKVKIPDKWVCVELLFDGVAAVDPSIWVNGVAAPYTKTLTKAPGPFKVNRFIRVSLGLEIVHGTSLADYKGTTPPALTDVRFDDLAVDSKRVGCDM